MSKFIQTHFFHPFTFPLPIKQKREKLKSFLSSYHFLSSHFLTPLTKRALNKLTQDWKFYKELHSGVLILSNHTEP